MRKYDIVVCGGGLSGVAAAVQARRSGAGSVLLEATDMGAPLYRKLGFVDAKGYMRLEM